MITNQKELRSQFWKTFPELPKRKIRDYSGHGLMYQTDARVAWCDWIDSLERDGEISSELADRATL
jgi:hypothetical protein